MCCMQLKSGDESCPGLSATHITSCSPTIAPAQVGIPYILYIKKGRDEPGLWHLMETKMTAQLLIETIIPGVAPIASVANIVRSTCIGICPIGIVVVGIGITEIVIAVTFVVVVLHWL